jgi:hypothetical protein
MVNKKQEARFTEMSVNLVNMNTDMLNPSFRRHLEIY